MCLHKFAIYFCFPLLCAVRAPSTAVPAFSVLCLTTEASRKKILVSGLMRISVWAEGTRGREIKMQSVQWNNLIPLTRHTHSIALLMLHLMYFSQRKKRSLILIGKLRVWSHFLMMPINHRQYHSTRVFSSSLRRFERRPSVLVEQRWVQGTQTRKCTVQREWPANHVLDLLKQSTPSLD